MADASERPELVIEERRLRARIAELARAIDADYAGRRLGLVVVLKGAFVFAADLIRMIDMPATIDFVTASSYRAGSRSSGAVELGGVDRLDIASRPVLIVEDILDTGLTSTALIEALRVRNPEDVAICALLRKRAAARLKLPMRYVGFEVGDDFVVGYGMDRAERYRNLRGIYRLVAATG